MKCGFCGFVFDEEEASAGCKNCPLASGCKMVKCPRCNYENPPEPAVLKKIRNFFRRR